MKSNVPLTNNGLVLKGTKNFIAITAMRLIAIVIPKETAYPLKSILIHQMHNHQLGGKRTTTVFC